ncbi:MAG: LptF/LptG family permease [Balneolaceae bacterium]
MKKLDLYIFRRLAVVTLFVLIAFTSIFILMDFFENSDEFVDRGATLSQIWNDYYMNYIPEMMRLVSPLAIFVACLILTGQMTERYEIVALKAAGVSLYRIALPFLIFGLILAGVVSYMDAYVIPSANSERIAFERQYLNNQGDSMNRGTIYRQESPNRVFRVNHYEAGSETGYQASLIEFDGEIISRIINSNRIEWIDSLEAWNMHSYQEWIFSEDGYTDNLERERVVSLNIHPQDLNRQSSDTYQLSYPEAFEYIESIRRIGAGEINLPLVQIYNRIVYPVSILVVCLIGFSLSSQRRKGGKGFYIGGGLFVSFSYIVLMKVLEPVGAAGTITPLTAALLPHLLFLGTGLLLFATTRK